MVMRLTHLHLSLSMVATILMSCIVLSIVVSELLESKIDVSCAIDVLDLLS